MNISDKIKQLRQYLPELLLLLSLVVCVYRLDLNWFNTHMSRDIYRSQQWNWLGPEIGWNLKRLPGPFYYWFLGLLSLAGSVYFILLSKLVALYLVLYLVVKEIQKSFPIEVLISFLLLFSVMPVYVFTSRNMWNPSLIILFNSLQFLFVLKFQSAHSKKWIYLSSLTAVLSMQVHFSTLIAYFAFGLSVLLLKDIKKNIRTLQAFGFVFIIGWLCIWYFLDYVPEFNNQLTSFYGANSYLFNRVSDLSYHLTLNLSELRDYDLFNLYFKILSELGLISSYFVYPISQFLSVMYLLIFIYSLYIVIAGFFKKRSILDLFLVLHVILFLLSITLLKNKDHIPYRYGLALYPFQFFLISYSMAISLCRKKIYVAFRGLVVFTFLFYLYFNFKIISAQDITGRAHHTNNDNLELTLKNKQYVYNFLKKNVNLEGDPFNYLHGRTANKFRLKEMNWEQTEPYFSLYRLTTGHKFDYREQLKEQPVGENWLLQLKNLEELKTDTTEPLKLTEMGTDVFPKNLSLVYLDSDRKRVKVTSWKNTSLILPAAFIDDLQKVSFIQVNFEMDTSTNYYLNLLLDDNNHYRFAYENNYELLSLKANNMNLKPVQKYRGYFLVQNQYIFAMPRSEVLKVQLELKLVSKFSNFSRLDIFSTESIMPEEELFPNTKPR